MSKQTHSQRRGAQASPAGQEHQPAPDRQTGTALQSAATANEPPRPHIAAGAVPNPTHEQIALRAYQVWEAHGRPVGTDHEDWLEAERVLRAGTR